MQHPVDISLAQWSLIDEWRAGKWTTLDFPRLAREDFDLNGVEFVNTLFDLPTQSYLKRLKQNAADYGVTMVLIMVDDEGDGCCADKQGREEFQLLHRKWVDIAQYLGCHAIRTNCRGPHAVDKIGLQSFDEKGPQPAAKPKSLNKQEALGWATESYYPLLEYASSAGIDILIENHGGVSNDPDWMVQLMKKVNHPRFGTYPDWREPAPDFDNFTYLEKTLPFAKGMSFRDQPEDTLTIRMMQLCQKGGFHGWYGIESAGRNAIARSIRLLQTHVSTEDLAG
jgi:L-ribulose-5-phosphate 3-epimerase